MDSCGKSNYHVEHEYVDAEGGDAFCRGVYQVIDSFGPWQVVIDPDDPAMGWIQPDPQSDLPRYDIPSSRVHESNLTWVEHMDDKIWAQPYMEDFKSAIRFAQDRWPRSA